MLLLFLCIMAASFGCVLISSVTRNMKGGVDAYLPTQIISIILGIVVYLVVSAISLDWLSRFWKWIAAFNVGFMLLLIPFGVDGGTGNKSWLYLPGVPFSIQAPEVAKVGFILLLAAQMQFFQKRGRLNGLLPVASYFSHTLFMAALIVVLSDDMGVALIYIAILLAMMVGAGIHPLWFLGMGAVAGAAAPILWSMVLTDRQKNRILITLNPQMDPLGVGWHSILSMNTLSAGGLTGQGLYQGQQTGKANFPGQHTDFIFTVAGEELGFIGCLAVLLLLCLIIFRVLLTARRAKDTLGVLVCFGVAGMMIFQTFENVLMCAGLSPVIGLTLPFFSCGGSSNVVMFAAMGLVSSVRFHKKTTWLDV